MIANLRDFAFAILLHAGIVGGIVIYSAQAKDDVVADASDPLLVSLVDPDADPTKSAGIVGAERGLAEGVSDGKSLFGDAPELAPLPPPAPDPEPEIPPEAEDVPVPATPNLAPEEPKTVPAPPEKKPEPKPSPTPKKKPPEKSKPMPPEKKMPAKSGNVSSSQKKVSFKDWQKKQRQNSRGNGKNAGASGRKNSGGKGLVAPQIDSGKIPGIGGGNGKRLGVPGGTGENGGDGGRAVANAQEIYGGEIKQKLAKNLDRVLQKEPLNLSGTVSVTVRLGVDSRGNVRFLEILGSADAQVAARVRRAVELIGKHRAPPEGRAFEMQIPDVFLRSVNY